MQPTGKTKQQTGNSKSDERTLLYVLQVGAEQLLGLPREGVTEEERTLANTIARYWVVILWLFFEWP